MLATLRGYLVHTLIVVIVGSLWVVGWTQELEDDISRGTAPNPRWAVLHEQSASAE